MLLALVPAGRLLAQYGHASGTDKNVEAYVDLSIPGVDAGHNVISGTNVQLTVATGAKFNEASVGDPAEYWDDAQFYHGVLTIGGVLIYERSYPGAVPGGGGGGGGGGGMSAGASLFGGPGTIGNEYPQNATPPSVRFASNHFTVVDPLSGAAEPAVVTITFVADFALIKGGVWNGEKITVTCTINPKEKNRMAMWKSSFRWDGSVWGGGQGASITDWVNKVRTGVSAARYSFDLAVDDHPQSVALADVGASTSAFINAHGDATGVGDNFASGLTGASNWLTWGEINTSLNGQPCQWVFIYACSTGVNAGGVLDAFNVPLVDGAYAGFEVALTMFAYRVDDPIKQVSFSLQAKYLMERLAEGYSIDRAVLKTNTDSAGYMCFSASDGDAPMVWAGDYLTTWTSVYLYEDTTPFRRSLLQDSLKRFTPWYIILEVAG